MKIKQTNKKKPKKNRKISWIFERENEVELVTYKKIELFNIDISYCDVTSGDCLTADADPVG